MKIGMSDRPDVAEIPCKFRCNPMSGRGGAGKQSEPPLPCTSKIQVFLCICCHFLHFRALSKEVQGLGLLAHSTFLQN